jgi:hypothetical protein
MFAEEKPSLQPLPLEPFRYYQYGERTVHLDGCVEVEAAYYSAPPGWIGAHVQVQWDAARSPARSAHRGTAARASAPGSAAVIALRRRPSPSARRLGTVQLLATAARSGPNIGQFCKAALRTAGRSRRAPHSGHSVLQPKSTAWPASTMPAPPLGTRGLRLRLRAPLSGAQPQPPLSLRQVDPLIRQLNLYRDLIEERTQQDNQEPPK